MLFFTGSPFNLLKCFKIVYFSHEFFLILIKVQQSIQNAIFVVSSMLEGLNESPPNLEHFESLNDHLQTNNLEIDQTFISEMKSHLTKIVDRLNDRCVINLEKIRFVLQPAEEPLDNPNFNEQERNELTALKNANETIQDYETPYEYWCFMEEL